MLLVSLVQEVLVQFSGLLRNAKVVVPATKGLSWLQTPLVPVLGGLQEVKIVLPALYQVPHSCDPAQELLNAPTVRDCANINSALVGGGILVRA